MCFECLELRPVANSDEMQLWIDLMRTDFKVKFIAFYFCFLLFLIDFVQLNDFILQILEFFHDGNKSDGELIILFLLCCHVQRGSNPIFIVSLNLVPMPSLCSFSIFFHALFTFFFTSLLPSPSLFPFFNLVSDFFYSLMARGQETRQLVEASLMIYVIGILD